MDNRIREIRELRGLKQVYVARKAGIEPRTLWAIETGRNSPSLQTARKLASILGTSVEGLFFHKSKIARPKIGTTDK